VKKKQTKTNYRVRNWKEYNAALTQRGSLTVWVSEDVIKAWRATARTGKKGHPQAYSNLAILTMLTLQEIYHLPLRGTCGFTGSIFELLKLTLPVPSYSQLSRRRQTLEVALPRTKSKEPLHLVIDSTGVKVFGEGEWKVRQHGYSYRRTWRKLHLAIDQATHMIHAVIVTTNNYSDGQILPELLEQVDDEIAQVSADGAYDKRNCYDALNERGAKATIPPQRNAKIWQHGNSKAERLVRDENLRRVRQVGRATWKKESGYHRRSLAETAMFREKRIFGDSVSAHSFNGQATQLLVRCAILNRMTQLGMPDSYKP
jgi:IS5 family transposase